MRVRNYQINDTRQMWLTRKKPAHLKNMKDVIMFDSGRYYGNTGKAAPVPL